MMRQSVKNYLSLIKFSHTVFALPFAVVGFLMGVETKNAWPGWDVFGFVLLCMVFARTAAMAFNRYIDRKYDARNVRTASREIPSGVIGPNAALAFVVLNALLFMASSYAINLLCFALSPVALLVILGYSLTKRFTSLCHIVLGLGLSLAPIGAYLAVTGVFDLIPLLVSGIVLTWTAGFDIIYAMQDEEFDRSESLFSIPVALGKKNALHLSEFLHGITGILMLIVGYLLQPGFAFWAGAAVFMGMLIYQHCIVSPTDLSRVNLAFGSTNGIASVVFGAAYCVEFLLCFR
jgi:4-hydroxybenzoate polyprenyltransferase